MAQDRSVSVILRMAAQDYISNAKKARAETEELAKSQDNATKKVTAQREAMSKLGGGLLIAGGAIAAAFGLAVKASADFDKTLSEVKAVSGATSTEMGNLRTAALRAGADTVFSASQAAQAEVELAKVGLSTADILGGALTGALNLAAAGGLDLADAATIAGQTMKIFGLQGKDVTHIADVLASGANKSAADVSTLSQALQQSGLQAAQTGLSLEDTVGTLSLFADNALNGSDAGTSFKTMLSRLVPQTDEQAAAMRQLGLDFFDANGNFIGIEQSAQLLQDRLGNLSVEQRQATLNTIFGSDAIRAATVLYQAGGAGVREYVEAVNDQGAAARVAAINMDNLSGDLETLKGSIETALIQTGSKGTGVLRFLAQSATDAVNAVAGLPEPVQNVLTAIVGFSGAALLAGGAILALVPKIAATRAAMVELGITSQAVRGLLGGPWGIALAAGVIGLGLFAKGQMDAANEAKELRDTLDQQTGALTENTKQKVAQSLQDKGALDNAEALGISLQLVTDAAQGQTDAMSQLEQQLNAVRRQYPDQSAASLDMTQKANDLQGAVTGLNETLGGQTEKQQQVAEATGQATKAATGLTAAQYAEQASAEDTAKAAQQVADAYDKARKAFIDYGNAVSGALDANVAYQQALADSNKQLLDQDGNLDKTKQGLDANTQAGRDNITALTGLAQKAKENALATYDQTQNTDDLTNSIKQAQKDFVAVALKMGATTDQANFLASQLGLTTNNSDLLNQALGRQPKQTHTDVQADARPAISAVNAAQQKLDQIDGRVATASVEVNTAAAFANVRALASYIDGIRSKTVTINTYVGTYAGKPAPQADGSILGAGGVRRMADGGVDRQAMFASQPILWAEAGPEAYIPLSPSKRTRSLALWAETGRMLGVSAVAAMRFADGGFVARAQSSSSRYASSAAGPSVSIGNITTTDTPRAIASAVTTELGKVAAVMGPGVFS